MSFGYDRQPQIFIGDSKDLTATVLGDDNLTPIPADELTGVTFTVLVPGDDPSAPTINQDEGTVTGDGTGTYTVDATLTSVAGQYLAIAQFSYAGGSKKKSVPVEFDVVDPFERVGPNAYDPSVDLCWQKLADCFDSEFGGPWLRDMTLARFDKSRISGFLEDVVFEVNMQQPQTSYDVAGFPYDNDGTPLIGQGLLVHTIRHLMRAYTEQPDQANSPVGFFDRTKYAQAWGSIYALELDRWNKWLGAYKLRIYNSSGSKLLVASKAGRLLPAPLRSRNIGRGYY